MPEIPEQPRQHEFSFEIAKVIKARGSGFGIIAVVALSLVVIALLVNGIPVLSFGK